MSIGTISIIIPATTYMYITDFRLWVFLQLAPTSTEYIKISSLKLIARRHSLKATRACIYKDPLSNRSRVVFQKFQVDMKQYIDVTYIVVNLSGVEHKVC